MAHIWVVVCLPPDAIDDVQTALTRALAPFEMYEQPAERGMWDTWRVRGGGEGAGFYVRPGYEDDPRLIHDTPNYAGHVLPTNRGECAGGPKALLDLARKTLAWSDVLTLDGWWVEESGVWAHEDWDEHTSYEDEPDCPIPPGGNKNYLAALPEDTMLVRVYCHG
ncbi:hypothetical protein ACFROC_24190 [Nocardia tengchongensis]|uniref:hypothetical protein n=1 Tax=Nocardia tengchongensis TaxID=2055889 RepID=UPI00369A8CD1